MLDFGCSESVYTIARGAPHFIWRACGPLAPFGLFGRLTFGKLVGCMLTLDEWWEGALLDVVVVYMWQLDLFYKRHTCGVGWELGHVE